MKLFHFACGLLAAASPLVAPPACAGPPVAAPNPAKFELRDGDRVVLLGNTLIEREQKYGYWETMLTAHWPDRRMTFRNLGWDGDTVWAESRGLFDPPEVGYKRMLEHVGRIKPTVIFLGYGGNEAFAGEEGLPRFVTQYEKLLHDLKRVSVEEVRFVILSPIPHERIGGLLPNPGPYNCKLKEYRHAIRGIAVRGGHRHVDLTGYAHVVQGFRPLGTRPLTDNGLHLTDSGYRRTGVSLTYRLNLHYGDSMTVVGLHWNGKTASALNAHNVRISDVASSSDRLTFKLTCTPLPDPEPEVQLLIGELTPGTYTLKIDGRAVHTAPAKEWGKAINLGDSDEFPDVRQSQQLRQAIIEKNRLYFHSWRPQNVTYLFGFRKHEQGQNAREVAEFEKLVAEKEKEIDRLKIPVARSYELVRVNGE